MFAQLTLYKTPFDEENVFVGESAAQRENDIETYAASVDGGKKTLPLSPYNPRFPFRLNVNYFEIERKYNYLKYDYYKDDQTTLIKRRWYFVQEMYFIDDQTTALVVREDFIGEYFYDIEFKNTFADKFTFPLSRNNTTQNKLTIPFNYDTGIDLYEPYYDTEFNRQIIDIENGICGVGYLILTVTEDGAKFEQYGTTYPINTYILPFAYSLADGSIMSGVDFYNITNNTKLATINDFEQISGYTNKGFQIVSSNILFCGADLLNVGHFTGYSLNQINLRSGTWTQVIADTIDNLKVLKITSSNFHTNIKFYTSVSNSKSFGAYKDNSEGNFMFDDAFFQSPFYKILLQSGADIKELNPIFLKNTSSIVIPAYQFILSLIPPYNVTFEFNSNVSQTNYTFIPNQTFSSPASFIDFKDSFKEFMRNNYNSMIQGLTASQLTERENLRIKQRTEKITGRVNDATGIVTSAAEGGAKSGVAGAVLGGLGSAVKGATNELNRQIAQNAETQILSNNQEKERKLQKLKLADVENIPNTVSFANDIKIMFSSQTYPRINILKNVAYDSMVLDIKMYGVQAQQAINGIPQAHERFDYLRTDALILDNVKLPFSQAERVIIEAIYAGGVRFWYKLNDGHFKDFNYPNEEITTA